MIEDYILEDINRCEDCTLEVLPFAVQRAWKDTLHNMPTLTVKADEQNPFLCL